MRPARSIKMPQRPRQASSTQKGIHAMMHGRVTTILARVVTTILCATHKKHEWFGTKTY